ncbi:MAG TPA: molybdopterin biosynthesis protein MoeA, partial [Synergistetes bacterium]|nr:molybdopterin biosynthesis protein MoeA [Synergistota bacterium]
MRKDSRGVALVDFPENISLENAWSIIVERVKPLERNETAIIADNGFPYGRVLASDMFSIYNLPHYPASAVDGYAVMAVDTARASSTSPCRIEQGSFAWVNTGGGVSRDFDAVVMIEDTFMAENSIMVTKMVSQGDNIRPEGEDVAKGQVISRKGEPLNALNVPLLIASGYSSVPVQPLPRTIFLPTGDEIVEAGKWINGGYGESDQAPETNSWMLKGLF